MDALGLELDFGFGLDFGFDFGFGFAFDFGFVFEVGFGFDFRSSLRRSPSASWRISSRISPRRARARAGRTPTTPWRGQITIAQGDEVAIPTPAG